MKIPAKLRRAEITDAAELAALDDLIFAAGAYPASSWQAELNNPSGIVLLAEAQAHPVAFAAASRAGDEIEIRKIGVVTEYRRHGIAEELIRTTLRLFGTERCLIDVSAANEPGVAFYRKLGFREIARRKKYYADGSDAIVMEMHKQRPKLVP